LGFVSCATQHLLTPCLRLISADPHFPVSTSIEELTQAYLPSYWYLPHNLRHYLKTLTQLSTTVNSLSHLEEQSASFNSHSPTTVILDHVTSGSQPTKTWQKTSEPQSRQRGTRRKVKWMLMRHQIGLSRLSKPRLT